MFSVEMFCWSLLDKYQSATETREHPTDFVDALTTVALDYLCENFKEQQQQGRSQYPEEWQLLSELRSHCTLLLAVCSYVAHAVLAQTPVYGAALQRTCVVSFQLPFFQEGHFVSTSLRAHKCFRTFVEKLQQSHAAKELPLFENAGLTELGIKCATNLRNIRGSFDTEMKAHEKDVSFLNRRWWFVTTRPDRR